MFVIMKSWGILGLVGFRMCVCYFPQKRRLYDTRKVF